MPRAVDRYPIEAEHDPNRSGTEFHISLELDRQVKIWKEILDQIFQSIRDGIVEVIEELTGIDITNWTTFLEGLAPQLGIEDVAAWVGSIVGAFQGINLDSGPGAILNAIGDALEGVPVVGDIVRLIRQALSNVPLIPLSSVGDVQPNLLWEGSFESVETISSNPDFDWDGTDGRTVLGCALATADGTTRTLVSNRIDVTEGHKLDVSVWAKYAGVTAAGSSDAIRLSLIPYDGNTPATTVLVDAIASPSGDSSGWVELTGEYTVAADVDNIVVELQVTADASAGTVRFDDALVKKTQKMPQDYVFELVDDLSALFGWVTGLLDDIADKLNIDEWDDWLSGQWQELLDGVKGTTGGVIGDLIDKLQHLTSGGQFDAGQLVGTVAQEAVDGLTGLANDVVAGFQNIFNGWFGGSSATGTPAEVAATIEAIKDAVINGYTVTTFASSEANWTVPPCTELIAILIGSGQNGAAGPNGNVTGFAGGAAGLGGSYVVQQLDVGSLPASLDIAVGTSQARSYIRAYNPTPHTGSVVIQSPAPGSPGGIATAFGFTPTTSLPGAGGAGGTSGSAPGRHGQTGESSALAAGGAGGSASNNWGVAGSAGGNVSAGASTKCGGGGGGGGQAASVNFNAGGAGGAGGYPGGGGAGGGAGINASGGAGGAGGAGVVWLFYR